MGYSTKVIRKNEQKTTAWSGGTTTELAIYPEDAQYSSRNFMWRLSSAVVELEESVFTSLPGIWRIIMAINGEMQLEHEGHHSVCLKPYEQDSFDGGWITRSRGKVRDFNLMLANGWDGKLEALYLNGEEHIRLENGKSNIYAFYCTEGSVDIKLAKEETYNLNSGDILLINYEKQSKDEELGLVSKNGHEACIIKAEIYQN